MSNHSKCRACLGLAYLRYDIYNNPLTCSCVDFNLLARTTKTNPRQNSEVARHQRDGSGKKRLGKDSARVGENAEEMRLCENINFEAVPTYKISYSDDSHDGPRYATERPCEFISREKSGKRRQHNPPYIGHRRAQNRLP